MLGQKTEYEAGEFWQESGGGAVFGAGGAAVGEAAKAAAPVMRRVASRMGQELSDFAKKAFAEESFAATQPKMDSTGRLHDPKTGRFVSGPAKGPAKETLRRPYKRKSFKEAVQAQTEKTADGASFVDPNTGEVIEGEYHYGHKYGREHRRLVREAESMEMNQQEFNDWVNEHPEWFQIESPESNVSHQYEKTGTD